jgi:coatomer protein complex subunit alpha (xenin)
MHMVKHSRLCGRAIVAYLQSKGFPEVALHFVRDPQTRFRLALACGNIEAAMESAFSLEQQQGADGKARDVWGELGSEALRQGNHQVVEMSYQRKKDFDRLSFLYMLTGDNEKLKKMLKISNMRNDIMGRYHNALLLGDAAERVAVLEASGNLPLAYISAKLHGLEEVAERIKVAIETQEGSVEGLMEKVPVGTKKGGRLLQPPTPIVRAGNWPTLEIKKTTLEDLSAADAGDEYEEDAPVATAADTGASSGAAWDDDFGADDVGMGDAADDFDLGGDDDMGWGDELDDLGDIGEDEAKPAQVDDMAAFNEIGGDVGFQMPPAGRPPAGCWVGNSSHAADHMAAGGASSAMQLLHRQIAASDFSNIKESMIGCYLGSTVSLPGVPGSGSMIIPLMRNDGGGHPGNDSLPRTSSTMRSLVTGVRMGYKYFQGGKFNEAKNAFNDVLSQIPLTVTENRNQANEMKEMLEICREYVTAIRIKEAITAAGADPVRSTELSAYFTHCNLQPVHLLLALRSAMGTAFKHKNFIVAASFARRLLELPDMRSERNADLRMKATKVLQKSEQMARNEHTLDYKENANFSICCKGFVPIYSGEECVKCSYCGSAYKGSSMKGQVCMTDGFCTVGVETIGLVTGS